MGKKNKRIEVKTRDNTLEGAKHTMRSPKRRNQVKVGLKPIIISNTNQFMQGDGRKT